MGSGSSAQPAIKKHASQLSADDLREVFDKWDADKSGTLDIVEMGPMLEDFGLLNGTEEENAKTLENLFIDILAEVDESGDGLISYEEFQDMVKLAKEAHEAQDDKGTTSTGSKYGDSKALSAETEAARKAAADRSAEEHAKHDKEMAARARELKAKK